MHGKRVQKHRDEQAENNAFVRMVGGIKRADRMQQLWKDSYPQGYLSPFSRSGKSKEEVFRQKAIDEGFTGEQVNRFLDLP